MILKLINLSPIRYWFQNMRDNSIFITIITLIWLLGINFIAFIWNLGSVGLIDETEPLFAEASRQMLITGDWITPFFDGQTRFDKPALIYWFQAIAYKIMGVNEWAVRLPSALAAVAVTIMAFYVVQWHFNEKDRLDQTTNLPRRYFIATLTSGMIAFNPEMIVWGRVGVSDMLLTGSIACSLLSFFVGYAQNSLPSRWPNPWYVTSYILMGAAVLTKGPVGIVLPGLILIAFALYLGKFKQLWQEAQPVLGIFIVLIINAPWYILVTWRNGWNFINTFFGYHNIERHRGGQRSFSSLVFLFPSGVIWFSTLLCISPSSFNQIHGVEILAEPLALPYHITRTFSTLGFVCLFLVPGCIYLLHHCYHKTS